MMFNAAEVLTRNLNPRERLIWWDQPRQDLFLRKDDISPVPFSIIGAALAIPLANKLFDPDTSLFDKLFALPCLLIAFYLLEGRFLIALRRRQRTFYGLTNERPLSVTPWQLRTVALSGMDEINLETLNDGTGSITFGRPSDDQQSRSSSLIGLAAARPHSSGSRMCNALMRRSAISGRPCGTDPVRQ